MENAIRFNWISSHLTVNKLIKNIHWFDNKRLKNVPKVQKSAYAPLSPHIVSTHLLLSCPTLY